MTPLERRLRLELSREGRRIGDLGLCEGREGNISARMGRVMLVKATGQFLSDATPRDFVKVELEQPASGWRREPSIEVNMHRLLYVKRGDVNAVVHTHPPYVTAFCVAGLRLDPVTTEASFYFPKGVDLLPEEEPGSMRLADAVSEKLKGGGNSLLLERHGLVTLGATLHDAMQLSIAAERTAQVAVLSRLLKR
ncbi:MAG TPA: class II aldolase/adducin family protein [Conexivisphaerales archaeon]|nr:class II aldolase/adducin family protein [Conexivisphaerales archaeon]